MSLNNIEIIGYNSLTNLSSINADEVNTDILTKIDPDIFDADFDTLEGINNTLTIQDQFDAIEAQIGNIGTSYWFSCFDTTTQTNPVGNTPRAMTFNNSTGNGIVSTAIPGAIKVLNTNVYNIQFSVEVKKENSNTSDLTIWLRKNGSDVPSSASEWDITGNNFNTIGWNFVEQLTINDYIQLMWASSDTGMTLYYQATQTTPYTHPAIPSVIITVSNITGEGAQGPQGPQGIQGIQGDRGPKGDEGPRGPKGDPGDGSVDETARALAGTALALATTAQATAILAESTAVGAVAVNGTQDIAIGVLQVKTQNIQYLVANGGTEISNNVYIPRQISTFDPPAVRLDNNSASFFNYGITCSDLINTTDRFQSTSGTSIFNQIGINRTNLNQKKIILYDNETDSEYEYLGIFTSSSGSSKYFNCEIDGESGSAFRWYAGNGFDSGRTLLKDINLVNEISYTDNAIFLKKNGFAQNIVMNRDIPNKNVKINMLGDPAGLNDYDGQIIQEDGNGVNNNTGTMTIQSGGLFINALNAGIQTSSTTSTIINSSASITLTSSEETVINSALFDVNASLITIDSSGQFDLNVNDNLNISTTSVGFDLNITASQDLNLSSEGTLRLTNTLGSIVLDNSSAVAGTIQINAGERIDCDAVGDIELTSQADLIGVATDIDFSTTTGLINLRGETDVNIYATTGTVSLVGITGATVEADSGITALRNTNGDIDILSYGNTEMTNGSLSVSSGSTIDFEATSNILIASNTADISINADSDITLNTTSGNITSTSVNGNNNIYSNAGQINLQAFTDINIGSNSGNLNIDSIGIDLSATTGNIGLSTTSGDITLTTISGTGSINLQSNTGDANITATDIDIQATNGNLRVYTAIGQINVHSKLDLDVHSDTGDVNIYAPDIDINANSGALTMKGRDGCNLETVDGSLNLIANGITNSLTLTAEGESLLTAQNGNVIINASNSAFNITSKINNSTKLNISNSLTTHSQNVQMNNNLTMNANSQFNFIPAGTINMSVVSTVPTGYLRCNGQAVSRSTYSVLYSAIGTTFGSGDGITTFNVPNFEGAFLRGAGNQTVGGITYTAPAIGTAQQDQVLQTTVYATNEGFRDCAAGARECVARSRITSDPVDTNTGILAQFQRQGTENRPFNYSVYYNIKY